MTRRADEDAFRRLGTRCRQGQRHAARRERERLLGRIEMVEVQRGVRTRVAAQDTRPAGLGNKYPLDLAPPAVDGVDPAALAAKSIRAAQDKDHRPVLWAVAVERRRSGSTRLGASARRRARDVVSS
jgi:hypothetical protein